MNINIEVFNLNAISKNRVELVKNIIKFGNLKNFCEIGVYKAELSVQLLKDFSFESFYLIDPWRKLTNWNKPFNHNDKLFKNIYKNVLKSLEPYGSQTIILRGTTSEVINKIENNSLDGVYIDGDHTLRGIVLDLHYALPKIKEGGFLIGDDLRKNIWQHGRDYSPTLIYPYVVYFAEAHNLPIFLLDFNQFLIINDTELGYKIYDYAKFGNLNEEKIFATEQIKEKNIYSKSKIFIKYIFVFVRKKFSSE